MEVFGLGLIVVAVIYLLSRISSGTENKTSVCDNAWLTGGKITEQAEAVDNEEAEQWKTGGREQRTRDLFLRALTELGCQYEIDDEDGNRIIFGYQGERFYAFVYNDRPYVWVRNTYWMSVSQDDIEEMSRLRRVINDVNMRDYVTTVYTLLDDDKSFNVHSTLRFIFFSQCPNLIDYLRAELDAFFQTKHFIQIELEKLRQNEGVE